MEYLLYKQCQRINTEPHIGKPNSDVRLWSSWCLPLALRTTSSTDARWCCGVPSSIQIIAFFMLSVSWGLKSICWQDASSIRWDQFCKDRWYRLKQFRPDLLVAVIKRLGADIDMRAPVEDTQLLLDCSWTISTKEWYYSFLAVRPVSIKPNLLWDSLKILKILKAIISKGKIFKKTLKINHQFQKKS